MRFICSWFDGRSPTSTGRPGPIAASALKSILNATEAMSARDGSRGRWASPRAPVHPRGRGGRVDSGTGLDPGDGDRIFDASLPRKPKGWDWGCRSVAGSSKPMADDCGRRRTMALARPCVSPRPQGVPTREAWRPRRRCGSGVKCAVLPSRHRAGVGLRTRLINGQILLANLSAPSKTNLSA